MHADLKPGHLLVGAAGDVKVLDFGIAKALAKTTQVTTNNWGTSAYASPERLEHGHVNEHVDFWSLGVILYEMLAGHRPYPLLDRNRSQLEQAIRTNQPRAPLPDSTPPELTAIVSKLLAYQVERRYQSAAAIRADLQLFLDGQTPQAVNEYVDAGNGAVGPAAPGRDADHQPRVSGDRRGAADRSAARRRRPRRSRRRVRRRGSAPAGFVSSFGPPRGPRRCW